MAHVRIWRFRPPEKKQDEFVAAYSEGGAWAGLFRRVQGYLGTELLRPVRPGGWWITVDRWESEGAFQAFQAEYGDEYRRLDQQLESLAGEEEFVGEFEASA